MASRRARDGPTAPSVGTGRTPSSAVERSSVRGRPRPAAGWPDLAGQLAQAGYLVVRAIGRGGAGLVVEARTPLGRPVALKVLRPELAAHEGAVRRFFREARLASELRHPGLVDVFETGWAGRDHIPYLAMEMLRGRSLAQEIAVVRAMPASRVRSIAMRLLEVLEVLHDRGIVHRDLKPANVFLVSQGGQEDVKVLDLGISKVVGGGTIVTRVGQVLGTPAYMAPEQVGDSRAADERADLWAFGAILFEMLTGEPPFEEGTVREVLHRRQLVPAPPLRSVLPTAEPVLAAVVDRCLRSDPRERFASAAAVRAELDGDGSTATRLWARSPLPRLLPTPPPPVAAEFGRSDSADLAAAVTTVRRAPGGAPAWVWALAMALAVLAGVALAVLARSG